MWSALLWFCEPWKVLIHNNKIFFLLVFRNLRSRFNHSFLGVLWLFLVPVCILLLYHYVFVEIFKIRWNGSGGKVSGNLFALILYSSLTIFAVFNESVMNSCQIIAAKANYVKRVIFPIEIFPAVQTGSALCVNSIILLLTGVLSWAVFHAMSLPGLLIYISLLLPLCLLSFGFSWFWAAIGAYFHNIGNLIGIIQLLMFFTAPVFYDLTAVPAHLAWIPRLNPLTGLVASAQALLAGNGLPDVNLFYYSWAAALLMFYMGFYLFKRLKRGFCDVL